MPVGLAIEPVDLGMMNEAIDEGDDAGSVGEHLVPFDERTVGGDDRARLLVAARDELEEEVGVAVGVGEVADLIDYEEARAYIAAQAPAQCGIAVERGETAEHVAGGGEQHGMAGDDGLVRDVWAIIVLPSPLGATRTTLLGSLRNSSDMSASIAPRSHCLGQAQSKSLKGLKAPIWASAKRRSSERRARACCC